MFAFFFFFFVISSFVQLTSNSSGFYGNLKKSAYVLKKRKKEVRWINKSTLQSKVCSQNIICPCTRTGSYHDKLGCVGKKHSKRGNTIYIQKKKI